MERKTFEVVLESHVRRVQGPVYPLAVQTLTRDLRAYILSSEMSDEQITAAIVHYADSRGLAHDFDTAGQSGILG